MVSHDLVRIKNASGFLFFLSPDREQVGKRETLENAEAVHSLKVYYFGRITWEQRDIIYLGWKPTLIKLGMYLELTWKGLGTNL